MAAVSKNLPNNYQVKTVLDLGDGKTEKNLKTFKRFM